MLEEKYEVARSYFEKVVLVNPTDEQALSNLIVCYSILNDQENELKYFKLLAEQKPNDLVLILSYCEVLINAKQDSKALAMLEELHYKYPSNIEVLCYLSDYYISQNKVQEGLDYLLQAKQYHTNHPEVLVRLGKLHFYANNISDAIKSFETAVAYDKNNPEIWLYLFNLYKDFGTLEGKEPVCSADEAFHTYQGLISKGYYFR